MISNLDYIFQKLGDGKIVKLKSGETIFKLDSFKGNPIVKPQDIGLTWKENGKIKIGACFNGGAELYSNKVILTARCHKKYKRVTFFDKKLGEERTSFENYISEVWPLVSEDGIHFKRFKNIKVRGDGSEHQDFTYGIEDIRIIKYGKRYLLIGCGKIKPPFKGKNADRIAIYSTYDFATITYHGIVECFDSRNAIPFSEQVAGRNWMLFRFHPNIHIDFLEAGIDQLLNPPKYKEYWKKIWERRSKNLLLEAGHFLHEKEKIGPGPQLIKTKRGWLLLYHAVGEIETKICKIYGLKEKIKRGYSICCTLLDLEDPRKVLCRTTNPIYIPQAHYELYGNNQYPVDVPAVVFPAGAFVRKEKLIIYAGAGDKYIIFLSASLDKLINYLWKYCK